VGIYYAEGERGSRDERKIFRDVHIQKVLEFEKVGNGNSASCIRLKVDFGTPRPWILSIYITSCFSCPITYLR